MKNTQEGHRDTMGHMHKGFAALRAKAVEAVLLVGKNGNNNGGEQRWPQGSKRQWPHHRRKNLEGLLLEGGGPEGQVRSHTR